MKHVLLILSLFIIFSVEIYSHASSLFSDQSRDILSNPTVQSLIDAAEAKYSAKLGVISIDDAGDQIRMGYHAYNIVLKFSENHDFIVVTCNLNISLPTGGQTKFQSPEGASIVDASQYCHEASAAPPSTLSGNQ